MLFSPRLVSSPPGSSYAFGETLLLVIDVSYALGETLPLIIDVSYDFGETLPLVIDVSCALGETTAITTTTSHYIVLVLRDISSPSFSSWSVINRP